MTLYAIRNEHKSGNDSKYKCIFHVIAKIQTMKNAVPKNDKKRRKQLTEDIAKLEAELNQKHENELKQLQNSSSVSKMMKMLLDVVTPYLDTRYT